MSFIRDILTGNRFKSLYAHGKTLLRPSHAAEHLLSDTMAALQFSQCSILSTSWACA